MTLSADTAAGIALLVLDVDGVLTDGRIAIGVDGTDSPVKRFHVHDGLGIRLLQAAGIEVVLLTGRNDDATLKRAAELDLAVVAGASDKPADFARLLEDRGLSAEQAAVMGDDLPELPLFAVAGMSFAPANARPEIREAADWVADAAGGDGAVREAAEALLRARGAWEEALARFRL